MVNLIGESATLIMASRTSSKRRLLKGGESLMLIEAMSTVGGGAVEATAPAAAAALASVGATPPVPASECGFHIKLMPPASGSRFCDSSRKRLSTSDNGKS